MNSAKVTLAPVKARGALDSTSSSTAPFRPSIASGTARTAASPRWRSASASDRSSRFVDPRSAMTSRRPVCSTSRTVGNGPPGRLSSSDGAPTPVRLRAVRTVNASSPSGSEILHSVTPTPSAATRASASSCARRSPATCGADASDRRFSCRVWGRRIDAQQRLDVGASVATMSAGAAVAGQLAGVAPAAECVEADAKLRRRFAEAEPAFAVRSSYAHTGRGGGGCRTLRSSPILTAFLRDASAGWRNWQERTREQADKACRETAWWASPPRAAPCGPRVAQ